jgi:hypothetical protein
MKWKKKILKAMKNKTIFYLVGAAALAGGLYFLLRPKKDETETILPPPVTPPMLPGGTPPVVTLPVATPPASTPPASTPPPPSPVPLKVGDVVYSTKNQFGVFVNRAAVYTEGGTNGKGQIEANKYAGVIQSFIPNSDWVVVQNFTAPMEDKDVIFSTFRLDKKFLRK